MPTDSCVRWCQALNRRCWLDCAMGCNIFPSVPHIAIMQTISKHMQIHPGPHVYQEKVTVDTWWPILVCVVWIRGQEGCLPCCSILLPTLRDHLPFSGGHPASWNAAFSLHALWTPCQLAGAVDGLQAVGEKERSNVSSQTNILLIKLTCSWVTLSSSWAEARRCCCCKCSNSWPWESW